MVETVTLLTSSEESAHGADDEMEKSIEGSAVPSSPTKVQLGDNDKVLLNIWAERNLCLYKHQCCGAEIIYFRL